jgi:hypothetical protein
MCGIMQLSSNKLTMTSGSTTGSFGTVCMGDGSQLSRSGNQVITGDLLAVASASIPSSAADWTSGTVNRNADLRAQFKEAYVLRDQIVAMSCDVTYQRISDIMTGTFDTSGKGVICFREYDTPTINTRLTGTGNHTVIFKLDLLDLNGVNITVQAPLTIDKVIWYVPANTGDVKVRGGGQLSGNIVAIGNKVVLSSGSVTGQIISDKDISLSGGSIASCPS